MKWKAIVVIVLAAFTLIACGNNNAEESATEGNLETQDIKELVSEYSGNSSKNQAASITSQQLIITDNNNNQQVYDLPEDEFFVSIAPYINNTHP